jgi:HTH-type transcriptional regulator/antitoxin HigA
MSQAELAARTGLSTKHVNQVIKGVVALSPEMAVLLELALGVPSSVWNGLECRYRDVAVHEVTKDRLHTFTSWVSHFNLTELKSRGVVSSSEKLGQLNELLRFFGVVDPSAFDRSYQEPMALSFRRAQKHEVDPYATAVWLRLGELQASDVETDPFDASALKASLSTIRTFTRMEDKEGFSALQTLGASFGLTVVFVPGIKGSRINGATKWLSSQKVMIALSDRYKWADGIWFTLFHELAHVLLHSRREMYLDLLDEGDDGDGLEREADQFARTHLMPGWTNEQVETLTVSDMPTLANSLGVDPGIVAGRYGHVTNRWGPVRPLRHKFTV